MPHTKLAQQWDERYAACNGLLFGAEPSPFIVEHASLIQPGARVLSVADGEGRNSVFLAGQGADVHAVEISPTAIARAKQLAIQRGVEVHFEQADLLSWSWPRATYDAVVAVFIQFVTPADRPKLFAQMVAALRPGGVLLVHGYRPEQIKYATGGPSDPAHCYTEDLLRDAFTSLEIIKLSSYDAPLREGTAHVGVSALVDLVARRQ
ncbi:MAG: class I SAM-dependent methyltransferase [Phycisphaerales bacterium]|nr:class I SAM-dependent methyltransferase [Phycisphaerales bacterium]